jgi:copper oxidase (laccase) domain-containing protein
LASQGAAAGERAHLDLPGTVVRRLGEIGVGAVDVAAVCTACETGRFFSHRRDGVTGRQALIASRLT